jgi:hypothetical protein
LRSKSAAFTCCAQVPSRLAVTLAAIYAVLVLIVLVNLLIAIVDETYGIVKESEADQILRNKALIIDEIESTLNDAVVKDLNSRCASAASDVCLGRILIRQH